jgi:2-dehydro-3-deoxy-L-rhamnonate dehydrogenase (NAD+)
METDRWTDRFAGQVAVVAGGADGPGRAIARRLAAEGATVWLLDCDAPRVQAAAAELDERGRARVLDITDEPAVQAAFEEIHAAEQRLDVLANAASILGPSGRDITETPGDSFEQVLRVNLVGSFLLCKHALPHLRQRHYGRVLLLASIAGKEGSAKWPALAAASAGVIGLTKSLGRQFADTGITINALALGTIRTPLVEAMDAAELQHLTRKVPMQRCGTLEEVASLAAWIVSPEASFNTGFTFDLSGGRAGY